MFKISVLADSLAMPRKEGNDVVEAEETWPVLLQQKLQSEKPGDTLVLNFGKRARTIHTLNTGDFQECVEFIDPGLIIVQVGVVDGMPRIFSRKEQRLLNHRFFPKSIRDIVISRRKKNRPALTSRSPLAKVWVPPAEFKAQRSLFIRKVLNYNRDIKILFIPVLVNQVHMAEKSPGFEKNISTYNSILAENTEAGVFYLPEEKFTREQEHIFCSDGYHLNPAGNRLLCGELYNYILSNRLLPF